MANDHDSTGAMAAAWFGTQGADKAIAKVFPSKTVDAKTALKEVIKAIERGKVVKDHRGTVYQQEFGEAFLQYLKSVNQG